MSKSPESIKVRRIDFGHENETKRHWAGNPVKTHFLNSFHSVFPDGEKLFIRSVNYFANEIKDPDLKERVKRFIGQEIQHYTQHGKYWDTMDKMGLRASEFTKWYAEDAYVRNEGLLKQIHTAIFGEQYDKVMSLAVTSALEHYTATLAEIALENENELFQTLTKEMQYLFKWHAAEEIEHKAVAYDVFEKVAEGNYAQRMIGFAYGSFFLAYYSVLGFFWYMFNDKELPLWKIPGYMLEVTPQFFRFAAALILKTLPYLKPGFHPDDAHNDHLAEKFFAENAAFFEKKAS